MIRRPNRDDNEEDILRMQEEFFKIKNNKPSAQVINLRKTEHQTTKRAGSTTSGTRKPSKYAQSKGLDRPEKRPRRDTKGSGLIGNILEKNIEDQEAEPEADDDRVYFPKVIPSVLGKIIEKNNDEFVFNDNKMPATGFPVAYKCNSNFQCLESNQFTQTKTNKPMEIDENNLKSTILSPKDASSIHLENMQVLSKMTEKEILDEKEKLLSTLDPKLVQFLKDKHKKNATPQQTKLASTNTDMEKRDESSPESTVNDTLWENDVLSHPQIGTWLHFNNLEKDKLEWIKGIEERNKVESATPYEARFNFKGYLLPYTMEYTEKTKTLFHHGEEPHRPGYSITELFELIRSSIIQQRVMALNTIAGVLEYNIAGTYKDIIEIPLSKIFFILRISLDENKVIILEPTLKAMRNLLFNRIDEACMDALIGFEESFYLPNLCNDMSEIEEMESKESELKDFHLAEIDIIAAVLRTDILQRLYYIMETIKPTFNCIQYSLQILIRLARDSVETAQNIVQTDHLMKTIIKNYIPATGVNFFFDPNNYKGKPVLAALKLVRILSLQSKEIGEMLVTKYDILQPLSMYVSSGVDSTYGLQVQIEAFSIFSNLIIYEVGISEIQAMCPLIISCLYKHVQGTDIFINCSVVTVTHAAVMLQLISKLKNKNFQNFDKYKEQIYPLVKDGTQKWLMQLHQLDDYSCGHLRLVSSILDCCRSIIIMENTSFEFLNSCLKKLASSKGFHVIVKNILASSNLLSKIEDKDLNLIKNLVSLGSSVIDSAQKVLPILGATSSIPTLLSLYKLLLHINDKEIVKAYVDQITEYFVKLCKNPLYLCNNWFTRMEVEFVYCTVKLTMACDCLEPFKDVVYAVSNKLCYILRIDKQNELKYLFDNVIFNKEWFTAERLFNIMSLSESDAFSKALTTVEDIRQCYSKVLNIKRRSTKVNIVYKRWQEPLLPRDWIYLPILTLYSRSQEDKSTMTEENSQIIAKEKESIIKCSLEWILFNEMCFADLLSDIDVTDKFCRIMCVFLCDNSLFLEDNIKIILHKCTKLLFLFGNEFNFDKQLIGLHNFQDLYTQFLEQFQSVSYGDPTFAACVLVPLAQRHNNKWRKLLWSEYAGCLRALDCPVNYLCYELKEYLYPEETDESILKSYFRCLSSNLLRPETIVYKIAKHHVDCFKIRTNK